MKTLISAIALALFLNIMTLPLADAQGTFKKISFEKACTLVKGSKKRIMIDFYTEWCGPCKKLDQTTWKDPKTLKWLSGNMVCLKVDAEKNVKLATKYKVDAYPTILFLRPDGSEIDRIVGYLDPKEFLPSAKDALAGKDALSRAKEKLAGSNANDPQKRMEYARALQGKERFSEALAEYLWCFDIGMQKNPAYYGVRLSFLLSDIVELGNQYPPAIAALKARRDKARQALDKEPANAITANEYFSLNQVLDDAELSVSVYLEKGGKSAQFASNAFDSIASSLIAYKKYEEFVRYGGSLEAKVKASFAQHQLTSSFIKDADLIQSLRKITAEQAGNSFEAYCGVKNEEEAAKILALILVFDKSENTFETLMETSKRAKNSEMAAKVLETAEKNLKPDEYLKLKKSASSTP